MSKLLHLAEKEYAQFQPQKPLWQSLEWKSYQKSLGRETRLYGLKNASGEIRATALVIIDTTAFGFSTWDVPRGPLWTSMDDVTELIGAMVKEAKKERCMTLYVSPNYELTTLAGRSSKRSEGWNNYQLTTRHEQPEATIILDLTLSDDDLLAQMKPKGRYNIRVAEKHGITVTASKDVDAFYALLQKTARRDSFGIRPKDHYVKFLEMLPRSFLLFAIAPCAGDSPLANAPARPIAALLGIIHDGDGYYYYGASDEAYRHLMAPYLLQWEAMKLCRERGCTRYDLLGIAETEDSHHPWSGVTRFKKQFGGEVVAYPEEREIVLRPVVKKLLEWKRRVV